MKSPLDGLFRLGVDEAPKLTLNHLATTTSTTNGESLWPQKPTSEVSRSSVTNTQTSTLVRSFSTSRDSPHYPLYQRPRAGERMPYRNPNRVINSP